MMTLIWTIAACLSGIVLLKALGAIAIIKLAIRDADAEQRAEILDVLHETRLVPRATVAIARWWAARQEERGVHG